MLVTNRENAKETSFNGRYVTVAKGNPTEVWFARMMELTARYEMEHYNAQRPLTIINWPPLDPMHHVSEASYAEELEVRRRRGENITEKAPLLLDDADVASVDIMKLAATAEFPAGLYASFHVYTYWPDFLPYDREYPKTKDAEGSNRYYGYLLDLKKHHKGMPLLVAEYGVPSSWGVAHVHPDGWHNGGFSEKEQAALLSRMSRNIYQSGSAGALVFAWIDEWWKCVADVTTNPFDQPPSRRPLWSNMLNPEEHFGLLGYRAAKRVPLLRGSEEDWKDAKVLSDRSKDGLGGGEVKRVLVTSDIAYLYVRLDLARDAAASIDGGARRYWVALNTLPDKAGIRKVPELNLTFASGANVLLDFSGDGDGRIRIASNYTPVQWTYSNLAASGRRPSIRPGASFSIADEGSFEEVVVEANQPRFGRDGTVFPPINVNRSRLRFGTADPASPRFSSLSAWNHDKQSGMIEIRIPWGLMYVVDPSSRSAMTGTDKSGKAVWAETPGIMISAGVMPRMSAGTGVARGAGSVVGPAELYSWSVWDEVNYTPYLKESYHALTKVFREISLKFEKQ